MGFGPIGLIGTLATTTLSIVAQNQQVKAANKAAGYNATLANNEAANREAEATQAIIRQRATNRDALAELQNRLAATGTRTDTGTQLLLAGESAARMELGIADAARAASMQARALRAQGQMGLWEASQAAKAGRLSMLATGIGGLTKAFGQFQEGSYEGLYPRIGKS